MNQRSKIQLRLASAAVAGTLMALSLAPAASAAEGDVEVVNTETIQVYTDATGEVQSSKVYEQIALTGTGDVDIANPIETDGLRNLDGFGGFDVEGDEQITKMSVDGEKRLRSVSDFAGDLPLTVDVTYTLDGEVVEPGDVVGESGALEVSYTVTNVTTASQEITFDDGTGTSVTKTVDVPIPLVGSLTTVAPPSFTDVQSEQANMAGDGKGGTRLSFTMTLFPPLGSDSVEFGYTAAIADGVVPQADVSVLPVNPLAIPTFKTAGESYKTGADTGTRLAQGAGLIDGNLLKLRDGAGELLAGLIRLNSGAAELEAGLSGKAAPGARLLADGAGELDSGLGRLDSGANQLADGAGQLSNGTGSALAGSKKLTSGLKLISGGLGTLAGDKGLPAAKDGIKALQAGVDQIVAGFGDANNPTSLIGGLVALDAGLGQLQNGAGLLGGGLTQLRGDGSAATPGLVGAKGGVDQVKAGLDASLSPNVADPNPDVAGLAKLRLGIQSLAANCDVDEPTCQPTINALVAGVDRSRTNLTAAAGGLGQVSGGLATAIGGLNTQLIPGAATLATKLGEARAGSTKLIAGANQLKAGNQQVATGLTQLSAGITSAVSGVLKLADGADSAYGGSSDLSAGLGKINTGAGTLADGAGQLADGAGEAASGSGRLAAGADELATGLGDAAGGSGLLANGLEKAADGAPALVDGAQRLSDEGTKELIQAGKDTAQQYGELYATIEAGSERGSNENMAYGAPEGAQGLTAYSFVIQGENGEDGRNLARGLGGLAIIGLGAGAFALRRRFA